MDIEKLVEQLNRYFEGKELKRGAALDAATALSALQAENKRLKSLLGEGGQDLWSKENQRADRLEAELEIERTKHQLGRCLDCRNYEGLAVCKLIGDCGGTNFFCGWFEPKTEAALRRELE